MSEVGELLGWINQSGGIPIQQVTTTNSTQFTISIIISLISLGVIFLMFYPHMIAMVSKIIVRYTLKNMKKNIQWHIMIIKHTREDFLKRSCIDMKTLLEVKKGLLSFKEKPFYLVLHTPGGEIFPSLQISSLLRQYPAEKKAVIPLHAMSGGTLLALSTDAILMDTSSCLGAVDPQIGSFFKFGSARAWDNVVRKKGTEAEDQSHNFSLMGKQYRELIKGHLLTILSNNPKKKKIIDYLTNGKIAHGHPLRREALGKLGLPVESMERIKKEDREKIEKLILSRYHEGVYWV